jgi:Fe-S-cluster-containing dehydrogenase component/formate-dependent nitrite reductase membrane component NrfD
MQDYGFVIDNRKCIGCHACSTACKSENEVPLGVNRTWVKYTETGIFPDNRRHFHVMRCNHCANPPCTRICPVTAMYQRDDGIVEFDSDLCIGCKACIQACPYDAIYIDPDHGTAAKCHYCAHRVELDLEPACVVVCPENAIISGDMNDPKSPISLAIAANNVTVRKPEQGTAPKLFYIDGHDISLHPTATDPSPETFMFADVVGDKGTKAQRTGSATSGSKAVAASGAQIRGGQAQGLPAGSGPIQIGGRTAGHMVQTVYNAQHKIHWHWPVPAYLVTKALAAGVTIILATAALLGLLPIGAATTFFAGIAVLAALAATTVLLIYDLERPERFLFIVLRPNLRSWLARGAYILISFSTAFTIWWAAETLVYFGWLGAAEIAVFRAPLLWLNLVGGIAAAAYTAFLLGQAEGRDLWANPALPFHMLVQSIMVGSAFVGAMLQFVHGTDALAHLCTSVLFATLAVDGFLIVAEMMMPHASEVAAKASHAMRNGRLGPVFWWGGLVAGHILPILLIVVGGQTAWTMAAILTIAGLHCVEYVFITAPQQIANS